jgi:hypothetical protein
VVVVMGVTLAVIGALNDPYRDGVGSVQPVAMERTLRLLEQARAVVGQTGPLPCDADGRAPAS